MNKVRLLLTTLIVVGVGAAFLVALKQRRPTSPSPVVGDVARSSHGDAGVDPLRLGPHSAPAAGGLALGHPEEVEPTLLVRTSEPGTSRGAHTLPAPRAEVTAAIRRSDDLLSRAETLAAHRLLSDLYRRAVLGESDRRALAERLEPLAQDAFFRPGAPELEPPYVIRAGDLLVRIARRWKVSWQYLERLNGIDARRLRSGQRIKVVPGPFEAVVDLSDFELTVYLDGLWVHRYRVGTGKNDSTPVGSFEVLDKVVNPPYNGPEGDFAADDPANPVGEHWIALGGGYGIHGTIEPQSIGTQASLGCIRMLAEDVSEVYDLLVKGSPVHIRR